jgi:signal transduction histidine kinase
VKAPLTPHRAPSPLRSYSEELGSALRQATRTASLLSAPLILIFALLDRALLPGSWLSLLPVRVIAALLLVLIGRRLRSPGAPLMALAAAACLVLATTLEICIFATGGIYSSYLYSVLLIVTGASVLLPLRPRQALLLHAEILAVTVLPLLVLVRAPGDVLELATRASYLVCGSLLGIFGATLQDRLRRREHQARAEFARHVGLVNLGTLAGGLAHELANPLTGVSMELEAVEHSLAGSDRDRLLSAQAGVARMRAILDAMRRGARFSDGAQRDVELALEIEEALVLLRNRLKDRIHLVREYGEVPPVRCEPTLLGQVLVNLVVNAADAVAGRHDARLYVRTRRENGHAAVEVQDNGPGVPAELRQRIFEPFFTTKGEGGNGLGLWISAEIARIHGGGLTVADAPGGGAVFRLTLPLSARI